MLALRFRGHSWGEEPHKRNYQGDPEKALVAELREYNVPVEYLRFEDKGHGMVRLANKLRAYPAVADFLDQHLQGANG